MSPTVFKIVRRKEDWNVFAFICLFIHIKLSENRYGMCVYTVPLPERKHREKCSEST